MQGNLVWPPTKEDLERLYLVQRLSAAKIAAEYGLKYKNPKVAESTVLYQLKKNDIQRRDKAEHVRKVTSGMVDEWAERYQAGESLKQIAAGTISPVTVWIHLRKHGVHLRDKLEAQIQATTKHERRPFSGDSVEKAYLMGLRYGDLHAARHGRAIRVRVSTTHPSMARLFGTLFEPYGHVAHYSRRAKLVGFEWTLECDLDSSFGFLLSKADMAELSSWNDKLFLAFLAGLFDAEGSIFLHKKGSRYDPEIAITNSDRTLMDLLFVRIRRLGYSAHAIWKNQKFDRGGIRGRSIIGKILIWRFAEVQKFLGRLGLRHEEKVAKALLVLSLHFRARDSTQTQVIQKWKELKDSIKAERNRFLLKAQSAIEERKSRKSACSSLSRLKSSSIDLDKPKMSYLSNSTGHRFPDQ